MVRKALVLLSGGIDSPVAAWLVARDGVEIAVLHMDNRPFTNDQEFGKVKALVEVLRDRTGQGVRLYTAPHGMTVQTTIGRIANPRYQCVLCRRMMFRTGEALAREIGAEVLVTGESLGQVASQTLKNMAVEEEAVNIPILRPLLGLDKTEIMEMARDIGTFDISTSPGLCCTLAPHKPSVKASLKTIKAEEERMDIPGIMERVLDGLRVEEATSGGGGGFGDRKDRREGGVNVVSR
ncbi:MAG: 7-cyano-7-deazaguanine synthase [Thermoplasmata archaeon]|nr:7-cyano-7-deazaguanine synthase [Thermoplasmata archaeon]